MNARQHLLAGLSVVFIIVCVVIAVTPLGAPRPRPASVPAAEFSAERAMDPLRTIAAAPRPIGSANAARVRSLIYGQLSRLGLDPHVQTAAVVSADDPRVAGTVRNVVGRLPGRDPSRAVLLVAHYDSVPTAAGAADDGGGVAALLETARALRSGPPPRNDIILLFTDGEERGLLGAQAFLRDDPWAYAAGVVLNFDSPGSSSPVLMYETSAGNGLLIRDLLRWAPRPYASSLMYEVSRRLPIESDFRPFVAAGVPGMSFGALDGPAHDHTGYDSLGNFHPGSLQHEGDTALALARHYGDVGLWDLHRADVEYFNIVDGIAVAYSQSYVLPLAALAVAVFLAAVAVAARRRLLRLRGVALSFLAAALALGLALLVMAIVWGMYRSAYEERVWTRTGVVVSDLHRLDLVLLAAAVMMGLYMLLLGRLRPWDLAVGALGWWAAGAVAVAVVVPGAAYLLAWPLLAAGLGLLGAAHYGECVFTTVGGVMVMLAAAAPGIVLLSSATYLLLMSAGLREVVTVTLVWLAAGLLVLPMAVVRTAFRLWVPPALGLTGFVVLMAVGSAVAFDAEHPKSTSVHYVQDERGAATWRAIDRVDSWTRQFLPDPAHLSYGSTYYPQMGVRATVTAAAPAWRLVPPTLRVLSDTSEAGRRTVRLRLRSPRRAAVLSLLVHSVVGSLSATVDGRPLGGQDTTILDDTTVRWAFDYYAPPARGIEVTLRVAAGPPVLLEAVDYSYGLPAPAAALYAARPAGILPGRLGDGTLAQTSVRLPRVPPDAAPGD